MKIFYDGYIYTLQKYGGIRRIFTELSKRIPKISKDVELIKYKFPNGTGKLSGLYYVPKIGRLLRTWDGFMLSNALSKGRVDIYHPTYYRLAEHSRSKLVITICDMIPEKYFKGVRSWEGLVVNKKRCVENADQVIAISNATKNDILEHYDIDTAKIHVVPLAASDEFLDKKSIESEQHLPIHLPNNYLLFVGNRDAYKNFSFLLDAFAVIQKQWGLSLVCVGGGHWKSEEEKAINKLSLMNTVFNFQGLGDKSLKMIYSNARMFVYPSLYEGFGIPLLEAMACGTPVAAARSSSFPEVAGDAAEYFDAENLEELIHVIQKVNEDTQLRRAMVRKGHERASQYSWERTAKNTYDLYKSLLDGDL